MKLINTLNSHTVPFYILLLLLASVAPTIIFEYYTYVRISTTLLVGFSLFFTFYYLIHLIRYKNITRQSIHLNLIDYAIFSFFIYILIRYSTSSQFQIALEELSILSVCFLSYFFIRFKLVNSSCKMLVACLYAFLLFGLAQSLYALCQWFFILPNIFNLFRLGGTYGNPGDLANTLLLSFAVSVGLFLYENKRILKILLGISSLIIFSVIVLCAARTAWIGVFVIAIYLLKNQLLHLITWLKTKISNLVAVTILVVVLGGGVFAGIQLYQMKAGSANGRVFIWGQCLELIADRPIFGHGYDSFITAYGIQQAEYFCNNPSDEKNAYLADDILFAYNEFLHWGVEYGLLGVLMLLTILILVFIPNDIEIKNKSTISHIIRASIIGILVSMFFSYPLQNATILISFFTLLALLSSQRELKIITFQIPASMNQWLSLAKLLACVVLLVASFKFLQYSIKWKHTYENLASESYNSLERYDSLLKILKYDKLFLYNYGAIHLDKEEYKKCSAHFEKYKVNTLNSKVLLILGECYDNMGDFEDAEKYYTKAMYTKPMLFLPKYKLFNLYKKTNQEQKAYNMALEIKDSKVKVFSDVVRNIKSEANHYLLNQNPKTD